MEKKQLEDRKEIVSLLQQMNMISSSAPEKESQKEYKFWNTQPVPPLTSAGENDDGSELEQHVAIDTKSSLESVRKSSYAMPKGFSWCEMDMSLYEERLEVYTLLFENYVEDDDNMFRFNYSIEFLEWALCPHGYHKDWHVGVRNDNNGKLVAFISGIPAKIRIHEKVKDMAEINFLCVHKKLRTKRLAPVLIKEITRKVNLRNVWQAAYTAGVVLPSPVGQCRYYHRSINPKKLIQVGFSRLPKNTTMMKLIKDFKMEDTTSIPGFRKMEMKDVQEVTNLLKTYLKQFKLAPMMDEQEVAHWILPRKGVINAYVVANPENGKITDFCSFYHLPSTVIGHAKHSTLNAAYSFYNVATSVTMTQLISDLLIMARDDKFDVFNALNLMENGSFMDALKFGKGDGELQYYLYNWRCPTISSSEIGLVLC